MLETNIKTLPLENSDRLTRPEFERRYARMSDVKKAELIEGIVYMSSPVRITHGTPHAFIMTWLGNYWVATPGVTLADNTTVRLDADNEVQPDALLRLETGGNSIISADGYVEGASEFIAEVASSSASYDLGEKLKVYRCNQVQEYLVWQVYEQKIDWFRWREGEYINLSIDEQGIIKSEIFPGLWLSVSNLISGNLVEVNSELQKGLKTSEHQKFLAQLNK
ncbi:MULTISPECIES: Uma2 family endonuclease [unclassified Okeania]|nr:MULTISPECIES: Uma2 family endonuclease [unclassified Okeania]NET17587.1 Uma2 family endonuclease [Okeania sp. SIO1H6]NES78224.1 Uma2 family endonuclease [Okeania sp. SIO1H4]NES93532.1 Uma2 family endonuclease [Okeania sp. SIO2B9]NET21525.1 Uma2 family endonuclease [Okeania sp. SIO1H5]NET78875.1 Uma2 family endonuclease [Okeania sp. SIO1F9]